MSLKDYNRNLEQEKRRQALERLVQPLVDANKNKLESKILGDEETIEWVILRVRASLEEQGIEWTEYIENALRRNFSI